MKIAMIVGTRPEIIKMSPVIRAAQQEAGADQVVWHTGQHYSYDMDMQFFEELELPRPDRNLGVGSASHACQTGEIMRGVEDLIAAEKPAVVVVQGDTNTVLGASLAAAKMGTAVAHVEAGLRSYDRTMPEEVNRVICDHVADVLYPPTPKSRGILQGEGIADERILVTGNTAVDATLQGLPIATRRAGGAGELPGEGGHILLTMHRAENVRDEVKLRNVLQALGIIAREHPGLRIIWPVHPHTQKQLDAFGLTEQARSVAGMEMIPPKGYLDMLILQSRAALVMTDSGGLQEEACVLGTPCVTLRENTERPESIEVGANELVGTDVDRILTAARRRLDGASRGGWASPFGDGSAGVTIVRDMMKRFG